MRRLIMIAAALLAVLVAAAPGRAQDADAAREVRALYDRFVAAQNARDLPAVRALLWDEPGFLWISDGKPFWGADTMITRMSAFQRADIWQVTPDRARARLVEVGPNSAVLFQPLRLTLGPRGDARSIDFLVNVLAVRTAAGWRIGALYTTDENPN